MNPGNLDIDRLFDLVKNDQTFTDGFDVLGKTLLEQKHYHMAFIALSRAKILGHPDPAAIDGEHGMASSAWNWWQWYLVPRLRTTEDSVQAMIDSGKQWREQYSQLELELLERSIEPTFAAMELESDIHERKIILPSPTFWESVQTFYHHKKKMILPVIVVVLSTSGAILLYWRGKRRTLRAT
jgi:hypothetical protein